MNLFGIGNMELLAILLVSMLVLGPARMVDTARSLGRFWNEAQRTLRSAADAATIKLDESNELKMPDGALPPPEDSIQISQEAHRADGSQND